MLRNPSDWLSASIPTELLIILCLLSIFTTLRMSRSIALRRKMPPGPRGLPWVGNKHQIPPIKPWRTFEKLNKQYGPVVSLFFGNTPVIVLGTAQAAWDLLEKRSEIYSSRPRFIMAGEILSDGMRGLLIPNNDQWRRWRKVLHTGFHSRQAAKYCDMQSLESKVAMCQILTEPEDYERHLQRFAGSVVVSVSYGRRIESMDEWIVRENVKLVDYITSLPGKYLVESWPWLLKLPRSLQWFRREAEEHRRLDIQLMTHLVDDVKKRSASGTCPSCLTSQTLENQAKSGLSDLEIAYASDMCTVLNVTSSALGITLGKTGGTLTTFVLAMLHFPEVMQKAQAEIDIAVGHDRMPEYDDYDNLPYVRAVLNESLRWRPVAVLGGTPHAVTADDVYNGMFIPKGSTVYANMAGIMNDPEMFPNPDQFRPERFIETTNPRLLDFDLPFGFGRRICPGMHLARNSLFINIARLLWGFHILPTFDEEGSPIIPDSMNYTDGFNSKPVSFDCRFIPRSEKVAECIKNEYMHAISRLQMST